MLVDWRRHFAELSHPDQHARVEHYAGDVQVESVAVATQSPLTVLKCSAVAGC